MIKKGNSIVGHSTNRADSDFYPTPEYVTHALLDKERFDGFNIWEPACGDGAMTKVLKHRLPHSDGYSGSNRLIFSSDIRVDNDVYGCKGIDFLKEYRPEKHGTLTYHPFPYDLAEMTGHIITNPPYKLATEFVLRAKEVANFKIAMFLKLSFLESAKRYNLFKDKNFPLKKVYVFSKRVTLAPKGVKLTNKGLIAYAWYVWDKKYKGEPKLDWIL